MARLRQIISVGARNWFRRQRFPNQAASLAPRADVDGSIEISEFKAGLDSLGPLDLSTILAAY
jgi:hypothetical protein